MRGLGLAYDAATWPLRTLHLAMRPRAVRGTFREFCVDLAWGLLVVYLLAALFMVPL